MKDHTDRIREHHAEAFRQARRHTKTCRACFIPIMDAEGNPGLLGEACVSGAVFLRNLIEAEELLRTTTQPAPQGQKEDSMGSKKTKGKKARKASTIAQARGQVCKLEDVLGGGPCGAKATHRVWGPTGKSCTLACEKHVPSGANASRIGKAKEPRSIPKRLAAATARAVAKAELKKHLDRTAKIEQEIMTPPQEAGRKKLSGLDAAVQILEKASGALSPKEITEKALAEGLWTPGGKTPAATLASAIIREIAGKGAASRFAKTAPGRFALTTQVPA